jgi:hypothetical protein
MAGEQATRRHLEGRGYEFCNCQFGCGCNFGGFPNSADGSCHALVGLRVLRGACGDVDLSGLRVATILAWPRAIPEGNGKSVIVMEPTATEQQVAAMREILTGRLGGLPWSILGTTFEVVGLVKAGITVEGEGRRSLLRVEGVGEGRGGGAVTPVAGDS